MNTENDLIKINGFEQVLEMLKIADKDFRMAILKQIAKKDQALALLIGKNLNFLN
jgi:hypothetical protein